MVVEGAGGWFAPISDHRTMADLTWALSIPALMVVGLKLGCLNHAQLTRLAIEAHGVTFAGWIASGVDPALERAADNLAALERLLGEPALAVVAEPRRRGRRAVPDGGGGAPRAAQPKSLRRLE